LQAAFERQRQFTADASHELRTPLTIIGLETDRALVGERSVPEYQRTLEVIQDENAHMTRLVNDLLVLARLESGQAHLKQEPVDLSDTALDVVERLSRLAGVKGIHLEAGELPCSPVTGDPDYLGQMISNLVGNAIKYAPAGSGMVQVETGVRAGQAWVRVIDNGPGIPPEDLPHLFERFYRSDKTRGRSGEQGDPGGSGLGLAIVRWVAVAHGGEVKVESVMGSGATFEATLPLRE
jgi:signal transduction histidine kinase